MNTQNDRRAMETLILKTNLGRTEFYLCDSRNYKLGTFYKESEAQAWCDENGYRMRKSY